MPEALSTKMRAGGRLLKHTAMVAVRAAPAVAVFLLVGVSTWGAIVNVVDRGWSGDAAAWVQATGSIAAIAAAAWISSGETRRNRKDRRALHEETAWHVRFSIKQAQFEAQIIAAELLNRSTPISADDVLGWKQRAMTAQTVLLAWLARTDHIHPSVIHVTANAKVLVDELLGHLEKLRPPLKQETMGTAQRNDIVYPHIALSELLDNYDASMRGVRIALDEGEDRLPVDTWSEGRTRDASDQEPGGA